MTRDETHDLFVFPLPAHKINATGPGFRFLLAFCTA